MSRINTNIPSLIAQRVLAKQTNAMNTSLFRLSTGYRINVGKDDPAGLIASENLRTEKAAIQAALTNISRANNVVGAAEGGLDEINALLIELESLVDRSASEASISDDERDANQLQIDAILTSINRIANNTEFQGRKLLSGDLAYSTSGVTAASNYFQGVTINAARIPNNSFRTVNVEVIGSAQLGQINWAGSVVAGGSVTLQVTGNRGAETLTFSSGTAIADMAIAVNDTTGYTGVSAFASAGGGGTLVFNSTQYGSSQFVTVKVLQDTGAGFAASLDAGDQGDGKDEGQDATVSINGISAVTDGLRASMRSQALSVDIDLMAAFGTRDGSLNSTQSFDITGGGANFMISPTVSLSGMASLGIQAVDTGSLGDSSVGALSSLATGQTNSLTSKNFADAQIIIRAGQDYVAQLRGRLGAFQKNTLQTIANSLQVTFENTAAAEASIRETDFASETSNMTRAQILVQAALSTLRLANAQPQMVLALLGS